MKFEHLAILGFTVAALFYNWQALLAGALCLLAWGWQETLQNKRHKSEINALQQELKEISQKLSRVWNKVMPEYK